ncbi:hypothetical protein SEA_RASPUTIA_102 [Microbacterium phage Rasputia]|nr:hypothetical protein SEA_RASPUTIA_102 [Microbacterium phage Rasputia]
MSASEEQVQSQDEVFWSDQLTKTARLLRVPREHVVAIWRTAEEARNASSESVIQEAARHVLWHRGNREQGWQPGNFTTTLLLAWDRADIQNKARLHVAFPLLSTAMAIGRESGDEGIIEWAEL